MFDMDGKQPHTFELYRYLLSPLEKVQGDWIDGISTPQEAHAKRRALTCQALDALQNEMKNESIHFWKEGGMLDGDYLFHVQCNTSVSVEQEYEKRSILHQPSAWLAIDTEENGQTIAVETGKQLTAARIINVLTKYLQNYFRSRGLSLEINSIARPNAFWDFVKKHEESIREVTFLVSPPNMAHLTQTITNQLSILAGNTQSKSAKVQLQSQRGKSLILKQNNRRLSTLVQNIENGAGEYTFTLRGSSKVIRPNDIIEKIQGTPMPENQLIEPDINAPSASILVKLKKLFRLNRKND